MKIKVSEASGPVLNHMVHVVLGLTIREDFKYGRMYYRPQTKPDEVVWDNFPLPYSIDWSQGGPIIERERLSPQWNELWKQWTIPDRRNAAFSFMGPTFLIAAMRCFVASKLGDEVEVPDELAS